MDLIEDDLVEADVCNGVLDALHRAHCYYKVMWSSADWTLILVSCLECSDSSRAFQTKIFSTRCKSCRASTDSSSGETAC